MALKRFTQPTPNNFKGSVYTQADSVYLQFGKTSISWLIARKKLPCTCSKKNLPETERQTL